MKAEIQFLYIFRVKWEIGPENIKYRKGKAECKFIKLNDRSKNGRNKMEPVQFRDRAISLFGIV